MAKPRKNPESDTLLLAIVAAAAVAAFAYYLSNKSKNVISSTTNDEIKKQLQAQGAIPPATIAPTQVDFSTILNMIDAMAVAIPALIGAAGVSVPVAVIVGFVLKKIDGFEHHAVNTLMAQWKASNAEKLIAQKHMPAFQKYLNDRIGELAWRATIGYIGWLDKNGDSIDQNLVYDICRSPEYIADIVFPPVAAVRVALRAMESSYNLKDFANAGDGMRFVAVKMFFDAAIVAGVPEALADCMAVRMATAAGSSEYAAIYRNKAAEKCKIIVGPNTTFEQIENKALLLFGGQ